MARSGYRRSHFLPFNSSALYATEGSTSLAITSFPNAGDTSTANVVLIFEESTMNPTIMVGTREPSNTSYYPSWSWKNVSEATQTAFDAGSPQRSKPRVPFLTFAYQTAVVYAGFVSSAPQTNGLPRFGFVVLDVNGSVSFNGKQCWAFGKSSGLLIRTVRGATSPSWSGEIGYCPGAADNPST